MLFNIAILVFAAVFCTTLAIYYVVQNRLNWQSRAVKKRLDFLSGVSQHESEKVSILRQEEKLSAIPLVDRLLHIFAVGDYLKKLIVQAGSRTNPGIVVLAMGSLGMLALLISHYLTHNVLLSAVIAPAPATLPYFYLVYKRSKRLREFEELLPEALDMIVNALRSGFTFELAIKMVAQELPDPLAYEFAVVFEEQNLGVSLEDSLDNMTDRIPNMDLRFFATAVILQRQTGGDLAEILDKIGYLVRERFKIWGQVQALTGEGRLSGIVLLALPPLLFVAVYRLNPEYVLPLFTDPMGRKMLAGAIIMQLLGAIVIKKIVNIKV